MPGKNFRQDQYFAWLASQVSPAQLSELYIVYADIESFCLKRKIIGKGLFELASLSDIRKVADTVDSNRVFRFTYKKGLSKMSSAMRFYYRFMKEHPELLAQEKQSKPETIDMNSAKLVSEPVKQEKPIETTIEQQTTNKINFLNIQSLAYTQPSEFSYFGEDQAKVNSWTMVYVRITKCLLEDYPDILLSYINHNIEGTGRFDFADEIGVDSMAAPQKVQENFYLETNISATDIVGKIKKLLDLCNVDYENLTIHYRRNDLNMGENNPNSPAETAKADISLNRIQFIEWMRQNGASNNKIFSYLFAISQSSKIAKEYGICDTNLLLIQDVGRLTEIRISLLNTPAFRELNAKQHTHFQDVLMELEAFRSVISMRLQTAQEGLTDDGAIKLETIQQIRFPEMRTEHSQKEELLFALLDEHRVQYVDQRRKGGCIWIIGGHELDSIVAQCHRLGFHFKYKTEGSRSTDGRPAWWAKNILEVVAPQMTPEQLQPAVNVSTANAAERYGVSETLSEKLHSRYSEILSECFGEDGYQAGRAIFRGRFKRYYAEKFGHDPDESDERIDEIMSIVGTKRDGRIFPKQDDSQNDLTTEILSNILSALDAGVSAVYIEAVFDRYRQLLADNLQIYNPDALASLLMAQANGKFTQKHSYLTNSQSGANSQDDLVRIMKAFHQPQTYAAIHDKAWFLPYGKMKSILVSTASIVNVASETYFYAPNLPVSADELAHLSSVIRDELSCHSHITDVRLMQLIEEKCSSIAINTDGYTTYGLRNCLGYIFRDQFSFTGPIIALRGNELSMADVYAEFAKGHEVLQVDELSELSSEMNIVIYWDSVLNEMIRVSATELVRKDLIKFDVDAIDEILDGMCPSEYMPLPEVNLFLQFPNVGYSWNSYLLESYLYSCSRKFRLLHSSFIKTGVYGAMVRKDVLIQDYRSLLVDVLSKSNALNSAKSALQYIVDKGYQQRRRYEGIEKLIQEAKLIKEQRENKEK